MRLIDADELIRRLKADPLFPLVEKYNISGVIEAAPTITDKEVIAEFLKQGTFKIHIPEPEPFTEPVKTGKWGRMEFSVPKHRGTTIMYQCSCCQKLSYSEYQYCPFCGARMDGDNND